MPRTRSPKARGAIPVPGLVLWFDEAIKGTTSRSFQATILIVLAVGYLADERSVQRKRRMSNASGCNDIGDCAGNALAACVVDGIEAPALQRRRHVLTRSRTSARTTAARSIKERWKASAWSARGTARPSTCSTGEALTLPAVMPLMTFQVDVEGDDVLR